MLREIKTLVFATYAGQPGLAPELPGKMFARHRDWVNAAHEMENIFINY
jgi:hypothetical protein